MIYVYDENTKLEDLHRIPLRRPAKAGVRWKGIPHGVLAMVLTESITKRGWKITDTKFAVSPNEAEMAGAFQLEIPDINIPEGQKLALGLLTSNAMKRSLLMVAGTEVTCCENGLATGQIVLRRKHTTGFNLQNEIDESLTQYRREVSAIPNIVASLREYDLSNWEQCRILMTAGREKLMPWSRIGKVDAEYQKPTFAEHGRGTSWSLLQAFTHHVKENSPLTQMTAMNRFRELLPVARTEGGTKV